MRYLFILSILFFSACAKPRNSFKGERPVAFTIDPIEIKPVIKNFYSLRVCEGYTLYKRNGLADTTRTEFYEEVAIRTYYNYDNPGTCEDCRLAEETYLYLDKFNDDQKVGVALYFPSYRSFDRSRLTLTPVGYNSADIRSYYTDEKQELNLTVVKEPMLGKWWVTNKGAGMDSIQINIPSDEPPGYFVIYAVRDRNNLIFKGITNPTIDKYSPYYSLNEMRIHINDAIRYVNDSTGLTFHPVNPVRKIVSEYDKPTKTERKLLCMDRRIERRQRLMKGTQNQFRKKSCLEDKLLQQKRTVKNDLDDLIQKMKDAKSASQDTTELHEKLEEAEKKVRLMPLEGPNVKPAVELISFSMIKKRTKRNYETGKGLNSMRIDCAATKFHPRHSHYYSPNSMIKILYGMQGNQAMNLEGKWNVVAASDAAMVIDTVKRYIQIKTIPKSHGRKIYHYEQHFGDRTKLAEQWQTGDSGENYKEYRCYSKSGLRTKKFTWRLISIDESKGIAIAYFPKGSFNKECVFVLSKRQDSLTPSELSEINAKIKMDSMAKKFVDKIMNVGVR